MPLKNKRINIGNIILKTIAVAGFISVAVLTPNALQMINQLSRKKDRKRKYYLETRIYKLKQKGLIKFQKKNGVNIICLTEKGQLELLKGISYKNPPKWDGKWRIIIFDIKEFRRSTRNNLRKQLVNFGFVRLQNSVWIYPYDCEDIIILLKADLKIGKDVLFMVVERLENDKKLKEIFSLI